VLLAFLLNSVFAGNYPFSEKELKTIKQTVAQLEAKILSKWEKNRAVIIAWLEASAKKVETNDEAKYWLFKEIIWKLTEISIGDYATPNSKKVALYTVNWKFRYKVDWKISTFFETKDLMTAHLDRKFAADKLLEEYTVEWKKYKIVKKESLYFYRDTKEDLINKSFSTIDELKKYLKKQASLEKLDNSDNGSSYTTSKFKKHKKDSENKMVYFLKWDNKLSLVGVDYDSFKEMISDWNFWIDRSNIYYKWVKTKITDAPTFKVLKSGYVKDIKIVLYCNDTKCLEVPWADAKTFEVLSNGRWSDKNKQFNTINPIWD